MDRRNFIRSSLATAVAASMPGTQSLAASLLHIPTSIPGDINAITGDGAEITLQQAAVQELSDSLKGKLLLPNSAAYDQARSLLIPTYDKHPAFVVQPTGAADVQNAVDFARDNSLLLAVKCGGHAAAGFSSCDKGMQIDLSQLRNARVDRAAKTARIAGGSLLGELDHEAMSHGLVTTAGTVSHTGVGGLTLGGGFGRLARRFGLSIDNVLEMDVVTPDGKLRRASADENPDLYWALRGGGGNFGVVTSFLFQLHEMQRNVIRGYFAYPMTEAKQVLNFYAEHSAKMPDEMNMGAGIGARLGSEPGAVINFVWCGDPAEADKYIEPLRKAGTVVSDSVRSMDYVAVQRSGDIDDPRAFTGHFKSGFVGSISSGLIDAIVDNFEAHPDRGGRVGFGQMGGAIGRPGNSETAFASRDAQYVLMSFVGWDTKNDGAEHLKYVNAHWSNVHPFTDGFYVNDYFDQTQDMVNDTYGENFQRLLKLKQQYDPTNLFRLNANIKPG
ncbi:MAG: FAD-binding oxidoreductase [Woeseiaceae bacterium]|nr:FAD-binding oxidoreductase [Woeseiaceae bacterium]MDX2608583.1 FAD-binding oxidoreductase [Woeseiaceae bacterium]